MRKNILYFLVVIALFACNNQAKNQSEDETVVENTETIKPAQIADIPWAAVLDSGSQKINMKLTSGIKTDDLSVENVTESINRKYPEIIIAPTPSQSNDTLYVKIADANYLTQAAGTMGAQIYLSESTYSFTQIPGINFVNFDFKVGDHALPGTYTRKSFEF